MLCRLLIHPTNFRRQGRGRPPIPGRAAASAKTRSRRRRSADSDELYLLPRLEVERLCDSRLDPRPTPLRLRSRRRIRRPPRLRRCTARHRHAAAVRRLRPLQRAPDEAASAAPASSSDRPDWLLLRRPAVASTDLFGGGGPPARPAVRAGAHRRSRVRPPRALLAGFDTVSDAALRSLAHALDLFLSQVCQRIADQPSVSDYPDGLHKALADLRHHGGLAAAPLLRPPHHRRPAPGAGPTGRSARPAGAGNAFAVSAAPEAVATAEVKAEPEDSAAGQGLVYRGAEEASGGQRHGLQASRIFRPSWSATVRRICSLTASTCSALDTQVATSPLFVTWMGLSQASKYFRLMGAARAEVCLQRHAGAEVRDVRHIGGICGYSVGTAAHWGKWRLCGTAERTWKAPRTLRMCTQVLRSARLPPQRLQLQAAAAADIVQAATWESEPEARVRPDSLQLQPRSQQEQAAVPKGGWQSALPLLCRARRGACRDYRPWRPRQSARAEGPSWRVTPCMACAELPAPTEHVGGKICVGLIYTNASIEKKVGMDTLEGGVSVISECQNGSYSIATGWPVGATAANARRTPAAISSQQQRRRRLASGCFIAFPAKLFLISVVASSGRVARAAVMNERIRSPAVARSAIGGPGGYPAGSDAVRRSAPLAARPPLLAMSRSGAGPCSSVARRVSPRRQVDRTEPAAARSQLQQGPEADPAPRQPLLSEGFRTPDPNGSPESAPPAEA
uniref:Protein kinase domain-containing protein n=1 Tax=Macrostomum lignano TaxID=282301 RepID=A0A1I8F7M9_9PLAT